MVRNLLENNERSGAGTLPLNCSHSGAGTMGISQTVSGKVVLTADEGPWGNFRCFKAPGH